MKSIKKISVTAPSQSVKLFILVFLFFITQKGSAQFVNTPGTLSTTSTNPLTINTVTVGKGLGTGTSSIAIGNTIVSPASGTLAGVSSGIKNTAVGYDVLTALSSTAAGANDANCGFGQAALQRLTNGAGNTAVGAVTMQWFILGSNNTAVGNSALMGVSGSSSGAGNSAFGANALIAVNQGSNNIGIGGSAGYAISDGNGNIVIGDRAGSDAAGTNALTTGSFNIAIGRRSQLPNKLNDGQLNIQNIIYGINNLGFDGTISTGSIGIGVVPSPTSSGSIYPSSVAKFDVNGTLRIRTVSPINNTTGYYLYADGDGMIGKATLPSAGVGSYCNTVNKVPKTTNVNGSMSCSQIYDDNTSVGIGNVYNSSSSFAYNTGVGQWLFGSGVGGGSPTYPTATGNVRLSVDGVAQAQAFYAYSDRRFKKNIRSISQAMNVIKQLTGVTYLWDKNSTAEKTFSDIPQVGFIAQDVEKVLPEAVIINKDGYYSMNYSTVIPVLTEGIKEQQTEIEDLKSEIKELKNKLNQLVPGETKIKVNTIEVVPNPITGVSIVSYKLDNSNAPSGLVIYDLQGKLLKQISLPKNTKEGQVQVSKNDLPAGMYIFALVSGNSEIQSKKVLVSE